MGNRNIHDIKSVKAVMEKVRLLHIIALVARIHSMNIKKEKEEKIVILFVMEQLKRKILTQELRLDVFLTYFLAQKMILLLQSR